MHAVKVFGAVADLNYKKLCIFGLLGFQYKPMPFTHICCVFAY